MSNGNGGRFNNWVSSGKLITAGWFVVFVAYCVFKAQGIDDPMIGNVFITVTGGWVGWLTLMQGKKSEKTEDRVARLEQVVKDGEQDD